MRKLLAFFILLIWVKWLLMGDSGECRDFLVENSRILESLRAKEEERKKRRRRGVEILGILELVSFLILIN